METKHITHLSLAGLAEDGKVSAVADDAFKAAFAALRIDRTGEASKATVTITVGLTRPEGKENVEIVVAADVKLPPPPKRPKLTARLRGSMVDVSEDASVVEVEVDTRQLVLGEVA